MMKIDEEYNYRNKQFICENDITIEDITLRLINENDIEIIREWRNNENVNNTFLDTQYITKEAQIRWYGKYKDDITDKMFIILYKGQAVGTISLYEIDYINREAVFGRLLIGVREVRGNNIGFKATNELCKYGFEKLNLKKITLDVFKDNYYAVNLYKKVGFSEKEEEEFQGRVVILMELTRI